MGREGLRNIGEIFVIGFAINRTEMKQSLRETVKRFFFFFKMGQITAYLERIQDREKK